MDELTRLHRTRASIRGQLTKLENQLMQIDGNVTEYEANIRLANLENYEKKFDQVQTLIEHQNEIEFETEIEQRYSTQEQILQLKLKLQALRPTPPAAAPSTLFATPRSCEGTSDATAATSSSPKINFQPFHDKETFKNFVNRLEMYLQLHNCNEQHTKTLMLLSSLPPELHQKAYDLCSPSDPRDQEYEELVKILTEYLDPKPSIWACQHKFISRMQEVNESITTYTSELKRLAQDCEFTCDNCKKSICNNFLTLQFIRGLRDRDIKTKILEKHTVTNFADLIRTATAIELAKSDSEFITQSPKTSYQVNIRSKNRITNYKTPLTIRDLRGKCFRCGSADHRANDCKCINDTCNKCQRKGHVAQVCLQPPKTNFQIDSINETENSTTLQEDTINDDTPWYINVIRSNKSDKYMIKILIDGKTTQMEVDTGAALSSMSYEDFKKIQPRQKIFKTDVSMRTYTGEIIKPIGVAYVTCKYKNQTFKGNLYIINQNVDPIFGRTWIRSIKLDLAEINIIKENKLPQLEELLEEFACVFDGTLGCIPDHRGHIALKDDTTPIFVKPRRIPYALKDKVDEEIERLSQLGVITKVDNSEWGTPVVPIVKPNGSIRLCADYKVTLNKYIKEEQYPIPIIEDILAEMNGGEVFCTLDISQAYLHMLMDEQSAMMQTLSTHKGTYRVNRLMFGVKVAPNLWQKFMDKLLQDITGVKCFFDDVIIQGSSEEQLITRLKLVLQKFKESNLKLNKDKCHFMQKCINYLGHTIDKNGLHKTKEKVKAILDTNRPNNINELRTFLGMANYYNKFIPNLASISSPLNNLLKKNEDFIWSLNCEKAFNRIKQEILSERVLVHFDPNKPLVLATDASCNGLGAVLSHRLADGSDRPIAFASRSLTTSEKKYSQIDKEATSIFWGLKKFFHYCYGRKFILITDHKPLTTIFNPYKTLPAMSTMRLFHYAHFLSGFDYTIEYRTSAENSNADYLSRFPVDKIATNMIDVHCAFQIQQINNISINRQKIAEETRTDIEYEQILQALQSGTSVKRLGYNDNELTLQDGCIIKGTRLMIPTTLRQAVLHDIHTGHLGVVKMKLLARGFVYWRNIDKDIEDLVRTCRECRLSQNQPARAPHHPWETPVTPWQRLHIDFAGPLLGHYLFIVVDAFSKWIEVIPTKTTTSFWCISKLKELFVTFGYPDILMSDNGRQFVSTEFETFLKNNGIVHKTSAPYHPATNGQAERTVQIVKKALQAVSADPGTLQDKLVEIKERLRRTPSISTGKSPYELMFGREVRTSLHVRFRSAVTHYSQNVSQHPHTRSFSTGQRVQIRSYVNKSRKWEFGTVLRVLGPVHYLVETDDGETCKRHVDQMLQTSIGTEN